MTQDTIAQMRLHSQELVQKQCKTPNDLLKHFGAMQAQDYAMAKWAIAQRIGYAETAIEKAINEAEIIRTHILRPTWHFVSAEDIRWMLEITAPQIKTQISSMSKNHEIDAALLSRCNAIIAKVLEGNQHLTREEVMLELNQNGINTSDMRPTIIMMAAEIEGLVCNGIMKGKQFTYALLDERVPQKHFFTKEEAMTALARKYFTSHGPATLKDFLWWSGLSVKNATLALKNIEKEFDSFLFENQVYWHKSDNATKSIENELLHFLPAFDEFLISYKDRTASISLANQSIAFSNNGIFRPIITLNGKVIGIWKREVKKEKVSIETHFFDKPSYLDDKMILEATQGFAAYLGKEIA